MPTLIVNIDQLPAASVINETDLLVVATPDGVAQKVTAAELIAFLGVVSSGGWQIGTYEEGTGGNNQVTISELVAKSLKLVFRSGQSYQVLVSGTPVNDQVLFDASLGRLVFSVDNPLGAGEKITYVYA